MPFAAALQESMEERDRQSLAEVRRGDSLEDVLNKHLKTVEQLGGNDVFTTILLLSKDGKRLTYGAAPTVPPSYCRSSESFEVGPNSGSCGAAAYYGRPVYSPDIAKDQVWGGLAELALQHGFRSCWSTPIRNRSGEIIGTFAILHRTVGMPTVEEIDAIDLIIGHVADAIMLYRRPARPPLKLVCDNGDRGARRARLLSLAAKLELNAAALDHFGNRAESPAAAQTFAETAALCREIVDRLKAQLDGEPRQ